MTSVVFYKKIEMIKRVQQNFNVFSYNAKSKIIYWWKKIDKENKVPHMCFALLQSSEVSSELYSLLRGKCPSGWKSKMCR